MFSCNNDKEKLKITDFSKSQVITLTPYKWKPYTLINIRVKGFSNDTVIINLKEEYNISLKLSGEIDTLWQTDYYGEGKRTFTFKPYKAKKGALVIEF
ncbi:MAG: hypothetical protein Q7U08_09620 [Flavobacteriaceae bacterium]|nr:hypothetical protein [Flavobacteriaceae bacterium]